MDRHSTDTTDRCSTKKRVEQAGQRGLVGELAENVVDGDSPPADLR